MCAWSSVEQSTSASRRPHSVSFAANNGRTKAAGAGGRRATVWSVTAPRRVAVVEDEETIREGICAALSREGHEPQPFDDGTSAWEVFDSRLPDLAVLD